MESNPPGLGTLSNEELARRESQLAREKEIANKLLDGREKLNEDFEFSIRRWPWELLQNASDASNGPLVVEFELADDHLEFRHNGSPFEMTNLIYLIEQTSVRERRGRSQECLLTVGKFGTGFMTTQLLSDVVQLSGVYAKHADPNQTSRHTYQRFRITLDRSGKTAEEMIAKINATKAELSQLDNLTQCPLLPHYQQGQRCDTVFRYPLQTEQSKEAATAGLKDLSSCLPFVFAFVRNLSEVRVTNVSEGVSETYSREFFSFRKTMSLAKVRVRSSVADSEVMIVCSSSERLTFAAQVSNTNGRWRLLKKPPGLPTIFVDFPLVGSEDWVFPGVVQSHDFEPNEKRSRVLFQHGQHAQSNRDILAHLFPAFAGFAEKITDFSGLKKLLLTPFPAALDVERSWFEEKVRIPIRKLMIGQKIIRNSLGEQISLLDLLLVRADSLDVALDFSRAVAPICGSSLPTLKLSHFQFFDAVFDEGLQRNFRITRKDMRDFLVHLAHVRSLSEVQKLVGGSEEAAVSLLNKIYSFFHVPEELLGFPIFPNQRGEFRVGTDLFADGNIPEPVKEILAKLKADPRKRLARADLKVAFPRSLTIDRAASHINEFLKRSPPNIEVALMVTCLIPDAETQKQVPRSDQMYHLAGSVTKMPPLIQVSNADPHLWQESDIQVTDAIVDFVQKAGNIETLRKALGPTVDAVGFLNGLYAHTQLVAPRKIFLSQVDDFRCLTDLEGDRVSVDLEETGFPVEPVRNLLLEVHGLIGKRNLRAGLLSPLVNTEKFTGVLRFFLLKGLVGEINEYLDNDKNIREPNFRVIFGHLRTLEKDFGFDKFDAYNAKKNEMNFALCEAPIKNAVGDLLYRKTASQRLRFVNKVSDEDLPAFEALDLQRKPILQLLRKLPFLTDLEIEAFLAGKSIHPSAIHPGHQVEQPHNGVLCVPIANGHQITVPQLPPTPQHSPPPVVHVLEEEPAPVVPQIDQPPEEAAVSDQVDSLPGRDRIPRRHQEDDDFPSEAEVKRAMKKVRRHLREEGSYDVSQARGFDSGLISGVKRKFLEEVPIVVIPSQNDRFEVAREDIREALLDPNAELWVTSGNRTPQRVGVGRLLKKNGLFTKRVKF